MHPQSCKVIILSTYSVPDVGYGQFRNMICYYRDHTVLTFFYFAKIFPISECDTGIVCLSSWLCMIATLCTQIKEKPKQAMLDTCGDVSGVCLVQVEHGTCSKVVFPDTAWQLIN